MAAVWTLPHENRHVGWNFKAGFRQIKYAIRGNKLDKIFNGINLWPNLDWWIHDDDFHKYAAGDWTITTVEAGAGDATELITDEKGGVLLITNDVNESDSDVLQLIGESFQLVAGKSAFFYCRFKIGDVDDCEAVIGMQVTDTDPMTTPGQRMVFRVTEADADGTITFENEGASTEDVSTNDDMVTMADATYIEVAFRAEGVTSVTPYIRAGGTVTNGTKLTTATAIPTTELRLTYQIENGSAAANTMSVDRVIYGCQR